MVQLDKDITILNLYMLENHVSINEQKKKNEASVY